MEGEVRRSKKWWEEVRRSENKARSSECEKKIWNGRDTRAKNKKGKGDASLQVMLYRPYTSRMVLTTAQGPICGAGCTGVLRRLGSALSLHLSASCRFSSSDS